MDVSVELTGLIKPDTPTPDVAPLFEYTDLRVDEDFMGQITGSVSLSLYDRALELIGEQRASVPFDYPDPYFCGLRVALDGQPVAWGLCTQPDMSSQQGRVVINMVDVPSVKMQAAFLRLGDEAIDPDSPYNGHVPPDFHGLRILRDAAELNAAQIAANWPTLSVMDGHAGTEETNSLMWLKKQRGDQVWSTYTDIGNLMGGPEWRFTPVFDEPGYYAKLDVYDRIGSDLTEAIVFHDHFGRDNLDDFNWTPGGKIITHCVMLSQDNTTRSDIAFHRASAEKYGVYMHWDAAPFNGSPDLLNRYAASFVKAYAIPPDFIKITPKLEHGWRPWVHYKPGDVIRAQSKFGPFYKSIDGRITKLGISQANQSKQLQVDMELIPEVLGDDDIEFDTSGT
jgi:hypothetical protein